MRHWRENPEEYEAITRGGGNPHEALSGSGMRVSQTPTDNGSTKETPSALSGEKNKANESANATTPACRGGKENEETGRAFPILREWDRNKADHLPIKSVPWEIVAPHEKQAGINHGQTIQRLSERGGLTLQELWHVVNDKGWDGKLPHRAHVTTEQALVWLQEVLAQRALGSEVHASQAPSDGGSPKETLAPPLSATDELREGE